MRYLVTGGSGFIGTNLINYLSRNDNELINVDINEPKLKEHLIYWKNIDIRNYEKFGYLLKDYMPNCIIHLAARTDLKGKSIEEYTSNTTGVEVLLKILRENNFIGRTIFTSSMYVCKPGYKPIDFDDYAPHTIYGESKVITEKIIKGNNPDYTWAIIRPTSIWGPYFNEPYANFFSLIMKRMYFHLGEKACKKTYGYIDNTIYQIIRLLNAEKKEINKGVFYLGDYEPYDITEWANEIAGIIKIKIQTMPYSLFQFAAWFGDILKFIGINFPMTSFRLSNMTTNNIIDLDPIKKVAGKLPIERLQATQTTIEWIKNCA